MRPVVLLTHAIHQEAIALLQGSAEVRVLKQADEAGLLREIGDADALLVRMPISRTVIRAGKRLRVVARHGVGVDYIPLDVCTELSIPVTNTPDANTESVADRAVRQHNWLWRDNMIGLDLFGRTLGVIGLGRIGSRVAAIAAEAFRMKVLGHDPYAASSAANAMVSLCSLEDLLRQSDFVTIHVPSTSQTKHMLDAARIGSMKRGSFLINAARGNLVESAALAAALSSGHLAGAALDVLEDEPPRADNPLLTLDNIIITPHSAALTEEAMIRMGTTAAEDILRVLRGEPPIHQVNRLARD
jgi:D-3-phosphoglycerate dehydrogenase